MIDAETFNGFLAFVLLASVPLSALLGVVLRRLYRRAVARGMRRGTPGGAAGFVLPPPARPNRPTLAFDVAPLSDRTPPRWGLAARYFAAGLAAAAYAVVVLFTLEGFAFLPLRVAVVLGAFAFPAMLAALHVAGLRWPWMLGVALGWAGLLALAAPQSLTLLAIMVGPALLMVLVAGNPASRTTAVPLLMAATALVVPMVFSLELILALMQAGLLDGLFALLPGRVVGALYWGLGGLLSLAAGLALGLLAVRLVARLTAQSSAFTMQHDLLWSVMAASLTSLGWGANGPAALLYLGLVPVYRLVLHALRPSGPAEEVTLLLRVFGQAANQKALARETLLDWRRKGPVLLIGAEDLATETLDAPELAAFLGGRLDSLFIETPADLDRARRAGESRHADGLFPMQDFYCRDHAWRATVVALMARARRVLVDLRGVAPGNAGIRFEIEALAERVPAGRILVVLEEARLAEVQALFEAAWRRAAEKDDGEGVAAGDGPDRIAFRLAPAS